MSPQARLDNRLYLIKLALHEKGQVIVSPSPYHLNKGDDCLDGEFELWVEYAHQQEFPEFELVRTKRLKHGSQVYQLRRIRP